MLSMVVVYYARFTEPFSSEVFKKYLSFLPPDAQSDILRYKRWQDSHARLLGRLLLIKGLETLRLKTLRLTDVKYTPYKRPYFEGPIDFNISHSGEYVVCALCNEGKIGVDIEKIRYADFNIFKHILSVEEQQEIAAVEDRNSTFYHFWTKKEAAAKADGRGLYIPLNVVHIKCDKAEIERQYWYLKEIKIAEGYAAWLASDIRIPENMPVIKMKF